MLRNPWGEGEWTGAWSDNSPEWTPELRQLVGCKAEDDGTFHIPLANYLEEYSWTSYAIDQDKDYKTSQVMKTFD